jgi:hypothetical protein
VLRSWFGAFSTSEAVVLLVVTRASVLVNVQHLGGSREKEILPSEFYVGALRCKIRQCSAAVVFV